MLNKNKMLFNRYKRKNKKIRKNYNKNKKII